MATALLALVAVALTVAGNGPGIAVSRRLPMATWACLASVVMLRPLARN